MRQDKKKIKMPFLAGSMVVDLVFKLENIVTIEFFGISGWAHWVCLIFFSLVDIHGFVSEIRPKPSSVMAKQSRVPKFGNWDDDGNVPYTAYFDSARKDKARGVMINPNDPEQNPEAFMFGGGGDENDSIFHAFQVPLQNNTDKAAEKHQIEGHKPGYQRNTNGHHQNVSQKSMASESSSDKSISDHSFLPPNHRRTRSDRKKSMTDVNNFCPPSPGPNRVRNGHNPYDDLSYRSASVPMFGQWDERDPKSGEGFTVIFNKVKEEKQIAASKFPTVPVPASNYTNTRTKDTRSKRCCCLF